MASLLEPLGDLGVYHHPKSPKASLESLQRLAGIIRLTRPLPFTRLLDADDRDEDDATVHRRAGV
jgi:hypothetical protein